MLESPKKSANQGISSQDPKNHRGQRQALDWVSSVAQWPFRQAVAAHLASPFPLSPKARRSRKKHHLDEMKLHFVEKICFPHFFADQFISMYAYIYIYIFLNHGRFPTPFGFTVQVNLAQLVSKRRGPLATLKDRWLAYWSKSAGLSGCFRLLAESPKQLGAGSSAAAAATSSRRSARWPAGGRWFGGLFPIKTRAI